MRLRSFTRECSSGAVNDHKPSVANHNNWNPQPTNAGWRTARTGILFDFDGVIALSEPVHMRSWEDLARDAGENLPAGFLEGGIGVHDSILSENLSKAWGWRYSTSFILREKRRNYSRRCVSEVHLVPGVLQAIERFADEFPIGIGTSSRQSEVEPIIEAFGLRRFFKTIVTAEKVTNPKPHPEVYHTAASLIGRDPRHCWVFEDSVHGAAAGRATGARLIALTTTHPHEMLKPCHMAIHDYSDLEAILREIKEADSLTPAL